MEMKAILNKYEKKFDIKHRKEKNFYKAFIGVACCKGRIVEVVDLRLYDTGTRTYACIWVKVDNTIITGSGYVTGYGYDRESAAADAAIRNAGIHLSETIYGCGEGMIRDAVDAITRAALPDAEAVSNIVAHA